VIPLSAPSPSARTPIAHRARSLARDAPWTPWVLVAAFPILFVHIRYQPKVSLDIGSTSVDVSLADVAIAAVVLAALLRGRREGFAPLRRARWTLVAAGALVALSLVSLATPSLLGENYALASHTVTALKFAWYALLLPAVVLLVRSAIDAAPLFRVAVAWSAVATAWGFLQFLGAVDEFEGRRPGQREPSFVGIHDFAALSGAALALGICAFVLTTHRPLSPRWAAVALAAGGAGVVLSGAMTGVIGVWLALLAVALLARSRGLLHRRGLAVVLAVVLATTGGTALMRADALTRLAELVGLRDKTDPIGAESYPQRALLAYIGARIWLEHPLTGVGWLASSEEWAYGPHLDDARRRFPDQPEAAFPSPEHPWGVQTLYIQVLADLGILGLVALVALAGVAIAAGVRGARAPPVPLVGLAWLMVCVGVWAGIGIVAGIPLLALTWIALGLVDVRD
jgi:O-antigen ligase